MSDAGHLEQLVPHHDVDGVLLLGAIEGDRDHPVGPLDLQRLHRGTILAAMGLNPFRQHRRSPADYVLVAVAVLVCVALVVWAFLG